MTFLQKLFCNLNDFDWKTKEEIGEGRYSIKYKVKTNDNKDKHSDDSNFYIKKDPKGTFYCAKIWHQPLLTPSEQRSLLRDILIISNVHHPAILGFKGFSLFDFTKHPNPTIITPYASNGSLRNIINKEMSENVKILNDTKIQICLIGIASALRHLHHLGIVHRNLKLENILLDDKFYPLVCDFGFARELDEGEQSSSILNLDCFEQAPEIFNGEKHGKEVDVYSFSMIAYCLITRKKPFNEKKTPLSKILNAKIHPSFEGCKVNPNIQQLIERCWDIVPSKRPQFDEICELLIDDSTHLVSEDIDRKELSEYIKLINSISATSCKPKLSVQLFEPVECIQGQIIEYNENDEKNKLAAIDNAISNPTSMDRSTIIDLFNDKRSTILANSDFKRFAGMTNYMNTIFLTGNELATKFLYLTYGPTRFDNKDEISKSDLDGIISKDVFCINISPTVHSIKDKTFEGKKIRYINLPSTIKRIGKDCFKECKYLEFINLPNEVTEIMPNTFKGCKILSYVKFPQNLTAIHDEAFKNCSALVSIDIPGSVKEFGKNAFKGCNSLDTIYLRNENKDKLDRKALPAVTKIVVVE